MPGTLTHSPGDVVRQLLIGLGLGTDPADSGLWPVFAAVEPNTPDNCITLYDTESRRHGRTQTDGEIQEHHGIQFVIRSATYASGYTKARAIAVAADETVYQNTVTISGTSYTVHQISRTGDVLALGQQTPESKRYLFTINAVVSLRQV